MVESSGYPALIGELQENFEAFKEYLLRPENKERFFQMRHEAENRILFQLLDEYLKSPEYQEWKIQRAGGAGHG